MDWVSAGAGGVEEGGEGVREVVGAVGSGEEKGCGRGQKVVQVRWDEMVCVCLCMRAFVWYKWGGMGWSGWDGVGHPAWRQIRL